MNKATAGRAEAMVCIEGVFNAPRARVFDAWINPELLAQWFAPDGCTLHIASIDVRAGGTYHWCVRNPEFGPCWSIGTYLEVTRPERLVFTSVIADAQGRPATPESQGHDPAWPAETLVRVTFTERGSQTVVRLEQTVSEALAKRTGAHPSWISMLARLNQCLSVSSSPAAIQSGYAPVNGIRMYYEIHGRGDGIPLLILHGGGSTIESTYGRVLPFLSASRRVIALEEQGHGRTSDRDQPVTFESSADDVEALLEYVNVDTADILGFSNGASVALQVALRHPERVRKLIFASSFSKRSGAQPGLWSFIEHADFSNMPRPLKDAFLEVNPDVEKLKAMHDKDAARMQAFKDVPDGAIRAVRAPTLVIMGDRDVATLEHATELTRLFPDARLLVLPGGHGEYLGEVTFPLVDAGYPELTARLIARFLDAPNVST